MLALTQLSGFGGGQGTPTQYDNVWTAVASYPIAIAGPSLCLLSDGRVLAFGGSDASFNVPTIAYVYNPSLNTWTSVATPVSPRNAAGRGFVLPDGKAWFISGFAPSGGETSWTSYDPAANSWAVGGRTAISAIRQWHGVTMLADGRIMVSGGADINVDLLATALIYNPVTNAWSSAANQPSASTCGLVTLPDGRVLACQIGRNDIYNPTPNTWAAAAATPAPFDTNGESATLLPRTGRVIGAGGGTTLSAGSVIYNPTTNTWATAANMPGVAVYTASVITLNDRRVLRVGGYDSADNPVSTCAIYS